MKKLKVALLACIACMALVGCLVFTACGNSTKYAIEWKLDDNVTVAAEGYDKLPEKVKEGAELVFTVTPANGYEIQSVSGAKKKSDGTYTVTPTKDTTITVKVRKGIESVTATLKDETKIYYAGQTIADDDITVSVKYKTNETETITSGYSIEYETENAEALTIGDKAVTVRYGSVSDTITLPTYEDEEGVVAKITLDLNGGKLTDEEKAVYESKPHYASETKDNKTIISWTFNAVPTEAIALPSPILPVGGIEFPFLKWTGTDVEEHAVPAKTAVCVSAVAAYETTLVELASIELVTEEEGDATVPYLVMKGTFKAANEVYLYLYEGNVGKIVEDKFVSAPATFKGTTVTKATDSNEFALKFNLTDLSNATLPEEDNYVNNSKDKNHVTSFVGMWMDIKLCTTIGTQTITQEINLNDYATDFIKGNRSIRLPAGENKICTYKYEQYSPKAGELNKGDNSLYDGTETLLKITYEVGDAADFYLGTITVEERGGKPYLVIPGACELITSKEAAEAALTNYIKDMQRLGDFAGQTITQELKVNDDLTFEILIGLENVTSDGNYVMHVNDGKKNPTSGDSNFNPSAYDATPVQIGYYTYTLGKYDTGWGWSWFGVKVVDERYAHDRSVILEGDVPYFVYMGNAGEKTAEEIKEMLTQFDFENEVGNAKTIIDESKIIITVEDGIFTVKVDVSELGAGQYWIHAVGLAGGDNGDVHGDGTKPSVTVNGKTYGCIDDNRGTWTAHLLKVEGGETPVEPETPETDAE
ncbi:MAG: hypothetical protein K2K12_02155 [Clostridia bacterium]|nr:hypothetical protein [Clostridia bacterium]